MTESESPKMRPGRYIIFAFSSLGLLIGNLIGLTAESVVSAFLPLLLAFVGGSIIAFISKIPIADRIDASLAVSALSLSCLVGLYISIAASEHQVLTPDYSSDLQVGAEESIEDRKYLRSEQLELTHAVDQRFRNGQIDAAEAYSKLREIILAAAQE